MTRIGLLGDTHADFGWIHYAIDKFYREDITEVIQLGDLGVWPGKGYDEEWDEVSAHLEAVKQTWRVVPGNHEDYDQIEKLPVVDGWQPFRSNIWLAERGLRFSIDDVSFVALGGAPSVDRARRTGGTKYEGKQVYWWPQEAITPEDVAKVAGGGYADVMLAHDAPANVETIERMTKGHDSWISPADLLYAANGRVLMDEAFHAVAPRIFIHGHYHFKVDEQKMVRRDDEMAYSRILGLSKNEENFSMGELNTEGLTAEIWDIRKDWVLNRWPVNHQGRVPQGWKRYFE